MNDRRAFAVAGAALVLAAVVLFGLLPMLNGWLSTASVTPAAQRVHAGVPAPTGAGMGCYADVESCPIDRPAHIVLYDRDPARGDRACQAALSGIAQGSACAVRPVNFDAKGGPGIYVEYDDDYARGARRCVETLKHDLNPGAVCEVRSNTLPVAGEVAKG